MTVSNALGRMMKLFDESFGNGQAKKNPAQVIELVRLVLYEARTGVEGIGVQKIRNAVSEAADVIRQAVQDR